MASTESSLRIPLLDVMRGILVFGMIIFHSWFHLFPGEPSALFFHFVPAGFVLFSGLLIGEVLAARKTAGAISWRGLKLLLLVILANIPLWLQHEVPWSEIGRLFLLGNPEFSAFDILIPISFVIISAPFFLKLPNSWWFAALIFSGLFWLDTFPSFSFTLKFFVIGILGIFLGRKNLLAYFSQEIAFLESGISLLLSILIFSCSAAVSETFWSIQILLVISLLGWLPALIVRFSFLASFFATLGRSSLILYFFHVLLIRILLFFPIFRSASWPLLILEMFAILGVCFVVGKIIEIGTAKSNWLRRSYRFFFA